MTRAAALDTIHLDGRSPIVSPWIRTRIIDPSLYLIMDLQKLEPLCARQKERWQTAYFGQRRPDFDT